MTEAKRVGTGRATASWSAEQNKAENQGDKYDCEIGDRSLCPDLQPHALVEKAEAVDYATDKQGSDKHPDQFAEGFLVG